MNSPIRIILVDDHPVVRDGLMAVLGTQADFEIVGEAGNGQEALFYLEKLRPDVLLLDLGMPEMDGVQVLLEMEKRRMPARVIVFTAFDTDDRILQAVQAGAKGYLLKGARREELFKAIRTVHEGGSLLQPIVASKLLQRMQQAQNDDVEPLTPRELEVLEALSEGLQNKEIALKLIISERTVKFHVSSILGKLNAGNRTEAVRIAARRGIIKL